MEALAASAISLVAPYLAKGAEEFAKSAGKEAFEQCKALAERLQRWWNDDPVAKAAADSLGKDPQKYGKLLGELLSSDLVKDPAFATDLRRLVAELGPNVNVVQKMQIARGVTGADISELVSGEVRVQQTIDIAENVTGFKANKVGGG